MRLTESRLSMLPDGRWPPGLLASASALDVWPSILPYTVHQIVEGAVIFLCVWLTIIVSFYPLIGKRQVWRKVIPIPTSIPWRWNKPSRSPWVGNRTKYILGTVPIQTL